MTTEKNRRILVVDDNRAIHDDFRKILSTATASSSLSDLEEALFSDAPAAREDNYAIDSAYQGQDGFERVKTAVAAGAPYALAFIDMRMPPGWDGVQTIEKILGVDDEIQIVICSAYSDYSWDELQTKLGPSDRWLILKKPFDTAEVRQLARALTEKWRLARQAEALRATLAEDLSESKEVERLKDEFISTVSHELRTPLTSIRGALGLLEGGVLGLLTPEALEVVQIARTNTDRLVRLINDILDLEKIEAGKLELKIVPIEIPWLIAAALDGIRATADDAGVVLQTHVAAVVPLHGDEDRLVQVITNLVSNAIKFSPPRGVVDVRVETVAPDRVRFSVTDRGPGIAAAQHPRLFAKFHQVDSSDSRGKGGTGLGLAISKAIVEQHRGSVGLSSCVGEGSTFWFDLPARTARRSGAPPTGA
jgi:two-component system sensor histidine kinase/response regulator